MIPLPPGNIDGISAATGVLRPELPGGIYAVRVNDRDVQLPDASLDSRPDCPPDYAGVIQYSAENPNGTGTTLPDLQNLQLARKLHLLRPKARLCPYIIPVHGWEAMDGRHWAKFKGASSDTDQIFYRLIRDTGGALCPEVYAGGYAQTPAEIRLYAARITAWTMGMGCGADVRPVVSWDRLAPMYSDVVGFTGAPHTDAEWAAITGGIKDAGGLGAVVFGWCENAERAKMLTDWLGTVYA